MKVTVTLEQRYERTRDGATWTSGQFPYDFWSQYLDVFDEVQVMARVQDVRGVPDGYKRVDGAQVKVVGLPYYLGPAAYLTKRAALVRSLKSNVDFKGAYILRVASQVGNMVQPLLKQRRYPYGLQVVCDPYDVFAPGVVKHPFAPLFRALFPRRLKRQCFDAAAAAYVTSEYLQYRYPCYGYTAGISDVQLPDVAIAAAPRRYSSAKRSFSLVFVGSFAQMYKAPDVAVEAVAMCLRAGLDVRMVMIGDGRFRPKIEAQAEAAGIKSRVTFAGQVSGSDAVRRHLDQSDLFLLPSRTEGLPRAIVEAMARGLPCIGSTVGGIPELLHEDDLVPPGDAAALAKKIDEVLASPGRLEAMSKRNLENSRKFRLGLMLKKQRAFLRYVAQVTEQYRPELAAGRSPVVKRLPAAIQQLLSQ